MNPISQILADPTPFLKNIFQSLNTINLNADKYPLDHICYRTETAEQYFYLKTQLNNIGEILTESQINKRPISTFKLNQPIVFEQWEIYLLELPSPKPGSFYTTGFEHIEFVIDESLEAFIGKYPHINFDKKGMGKKINPDVRIKFDGFSIKFHLHDLEYVIKYLD